MSELWECIGPSWRLPLAIMWYDELAEIAVPIPLLKVQETALNKLLGSVTFERGGRKWIYKHDLHKIAHRSERTDPEEVVEWLPAREPVPAKEVLDDKFIDGYCASQYAISRDPVIMDAIWASFCKYMLSHFINKEEEVDFGFMKIVPLLFRKNWSNAVARWEQQQYWVKHCMLKSDFLNPSVTSMVFRKVPDCLVTDQMTAFDSESRVLKSTLDIVVGPEFYEASIKREQARKRAWLRVRYFKQVTERLKRQLPKALSVYAHHLKEARSQYCEINYSNGSRSGSEQRRGFPDGQGQEAAGHWNEDHVLFPAHHGEGQSGPVRSADVSV